MCSPGLAQIVPPVAIPSLGGWSCSLSGPAASPQGFCCTSLVSTNTVWSSWQVFLQIPVWTSLTDGSGPFLPLSRSFFFLIIYHLFIIIQCSACMFARHKRVLDLSVDSCEPPCGCCESNPGLPQKQQVLLAMDPSFQSPNLISLNCVEYLFRK